MIPMGNARAVLFTDLDGTLLDSRSYEPSREAVEVVTEMGESGVVTVPVTSKTASEVLRLEVILDIAPCAGGGGVAWRLRPGGDTGVRGPPGSRAVGILQELLRAGHRIRGLSEMSVDEVAQRTGLSRRAARRAMDREASEPFVFLEEPGSAEVEAVRRNVRELGASLARGDRLWHLAGAGVDKGRGVEAVFERFPNLASVPAGAVGDAWNDLPMLCRVEHRYLLGGVVTDGELTCRVERIPEPGPPGFVQACRRFLACLGDA